MTSHTVRWAALLAVVAIGTGCGGGDDEVDEFETDEEMQPAGETWSADDDGVGEFTITMSGDMTGEVTGTQVKCVQFRETRSITMEGEHEGERLDVALSDETFDDGTFGKVIFGSYIRQAGQGGTLTVDENGATFEDLEVGVVTITGSVSC